MEKDPVLEKYYNEGFGKNAFGWYFNPWIDEYDENYDPHNDKEYNEKLNKKEIKWHPKLTPEQIEELIAENIEPGDNEYDMYLWNHGITPFEKKDDKNKGGTNKGNDNPDKNQGADNNSGKDDGTDKNAGKGDGSDNNTGKDDGTDKKSNLTSIEINPISDLKLTYKYMQDKEEKTDKSEKSICYDDTYIENIKKIIKQHGFKIDNISKGIDPNIIGLLINNPEKLNFTMEDYLDMLNGKKDPGVKIKYSLKDIYKSELPLVEIKNVIRIAKEAKKLNKDSIQVDKHSFLKEQFENLKNFTRRLFRKRLPAKKKEEKIDLNEFATNKEKNSRYVPKHSKQTIISKANSMATSLGKKVVGGLKLVDTRLTGYLRGENKFLINNTVREIRKKYFVPKAEVDEKAAIEKANSSKGFTEVEKAPIK